MSTPSAKQIVELLMRKTGEQERSVTNRSNPSLQRKQLFNVYSCPKGEHCTNGGEFLFAKNAGYTNPINHLKSCLAGGDMKKLIDIYEARKSALAVGSPFQKTVLVTEREKSMFLCLNLIVSQNLPVSIVEEPEFRAQAKYAVKFSRSTVRGVLLKLVEIVEEKIRLELKNTRGAIMYDGWTYNGTHYLGIIAIYNKKVQILRDHAWIENEAVVMPLISVSPIAHVAIENENTETLTDETTEFNSVAHIRQFETVFDLFHQDVHRWAVCLISDNCSVNLKISRLMELPHVGCLNHKLQLDIQDMIDSDSRLSHTINSIHQTMQKCKSSLKNRATLRKITDLSPIVHNQTRWTSKFAMIQRFNRIRNDLIQAASEENTSISLNTSEIFKEQSIHYGKMLSLFNIATVELQKKKATLHECRCVIEALVDTIEKEKCDTESPFHDCKFKPNRINLKGKLSPDSNFESGVCKIQMQAQGLMTEDEKTACRHLLKTQKKNQRGESSSQSFLDTIARKKRRYEMKNEYINCDFIQGSTAEIERVWSVSKHIMKHTRKSMEPLMFEAILFLKFNREYWNQESVQAAMKIV